MSLEATDTAVESALSVLDRLIAFPTVSSQTNLPLLDYVEEILRPTGARFTRVFDETGEKANLIAAFGPQVAGGIVLSGHSDVVPVAGQDWHTDPFRMTAQGDKVAGRGTADMKGFVAACVAGLAGVQSADLNRPIYLCVSYDEEVGCLGAHSLAQRLVADEPMPAYAIIGEPTEMRIVTSHKSAVVLETTFGGFAAHSSQSHIGVSATLAGARFMTELDRRFEAMKAEAEAGIPHGSNLMPPYPTMNVGVISGGTAHNIIPSAASLTWQYRMMPDQNPQSVADEMEDYIRSSLIPEFSNASHTLTVTTRQKAMVPPLNPDGNRAAREALMALGPYDGDDGVAFGTEAGIFQRAGIPSVVCGPGTIEVAHQPNEALPVSELAAATALVARVVAAARG